MGLFPDIFRQINVNVLLLVTPISAETRYENDFKKFNFLTIFVLYFALREQNLA